MLRYLTHKLRTQSLNESETYHVKIDDDRDSGTESDDEGAEIEELQKYMESIIHLEQQQQHSLRPPPRRCAALRGGRGPTPPQVTTGGKTPPRRRASESPCDPLDPGHSSEEELEVINGGKRKWGERPVEFRASPPPRTRRPGVGGAGGDLPPHELLCPSPRKRHRRTTPPRRPCLDFEKMQQINRVRLL